MVNSQALLATAADSRNDTVSTLAVLAAGIVGTVFHLRIDGIMGLAVAAFILYSGVNMAKETISPLLGENASPQLRQQIVELVNACPEVLGYHDLLVHDYGPGQRFATVQVEMDQQADPPVCHELIDNLIRSNETLTIPTVHRDGHTMLVNADAWQTPKRYPQKMAEYK